jgi:hypothetical protein
MGNHNSTPDLIDTSILNNEHIFKVDNINSYGQKHSSAKIEVSNDNLCIHQKHRQSLFIPLDTIKRYGLDGSIFILECGRRAPLGQARYAFRCKQAQHLVDCLDQQIATVSNQLLDQHQDVSSLSLTNVSSTLNNLRRTQSAMSLSSATSFYRNSEPDLSENYFAFGKENDAQSNTVEMNYAEFKTEIKSNMTPSTNQNDTTLAPATCIQELSTAGKSYMYIDHEKTTTLKEITKERLQQHSRRIES